MQVFTHVLLAAIVAIPVVPSIGSAQLAPGVYVGARIRSDAWTVWQVTGTVVEARGDSLVVKSDLTGAPLVLNRLHIGGLEIRDGERRHALKGLTLGLLAGAGTGAIIGFADGDDTCPSEPGGFGCWFSMSAPEKAGVLGIVFGGLGAVVGAVTGYLVKSDNWVAADANKVNVSPIIGGAGRVGVSLQF
jgi:hypothetical protein